MPLKTLPLVFFGALFVATAAVIGTTAYRYPLFPTQTDDLNWTVAWLKATVMDYYGSTLCYAGVVIASEDSWIAGILWVLGFCFLGSPVCCVWAFLRVMRTGSLRIEPKPTAVSGTEQQQFYGTN